jgi:hypothetical protein
MAFNILLGIGIGIRLLTVVHSTEKTNSAIHSPSQSASHTQTFFPFFYF